MAEENSVAPKGNAAPAESGRVLSAAPLSTPDTSHLLAGERGPGSQVPTPSARIAATRPSAEAAASAGRLGDFFQRFRGSRRLRFTREGKFFVGITFGVGFAAINTANNLLYLLLGMLLALIVVSGIMSELSLRQLTVVRRLPLRAQVGRAHLVEIEVFNHKGRVPSYAIEVEDLRAGQPADKRCFFLKVSPQSAQVAAYRRTPTRRGLDVHTGFRIATRFPFGLFEKSREVKARGELVIYPAVDPLKLPPPPAGSASGTTGAAGRGHGEDFMGLRPMRDGEDPRDIHWRKSAAVGQLVLRERATETRPDVTLGLDVFKPETAGDEWDVGFEKRIREVASRAVAHLKRGDRVAVVSNAGGLVRSDRAAGADPVLRFLARLESVRDGSGFTRHSIAPYRASLPPPRLQPSFDPKPGGAA